MKTIMEEFSEIWDKTQTLKNDMIKTGMLDDNHKVHNWEQDENGATYCTDCDVNVCAVCKTTIESDAELTCPNHAQEP
jgi:hypothetical protein